MKTSYLIIFIFLSVIQNSLAQAFYCFKSIDKDYFPSLLCLFGGDASSFCYVEKMDGNLYLERGTYTFNGDSIFLTINEIEVGFVKENSRNAVFLANSVISTHSLELSNKGNLVRQDVANERQNDFKRGLIKRKAIIILNEKGDPYLKLKRTKCRPRSLMCDKCLCHYQGATVNCVNVSSFGLWLNGIPNFGIHPYLLHYSIVAYNNGFRPDIFGHFFQFRR